MSGADDLRAFAADIGRIAVEAAVEVDKVLEVGANRVKANLNEAYAASKHFKGVQGSVTYDQVSAGEQIGYEIGPDKSIKRGRHANIAHFGTPRGGGTVPLEPALEQEAPQVVSYLDALMARWAAL